MHEYAKHQHLLKPKYASQPRYPSDEEEDDKRHAPKERRSRGGTGSCHDPKHTAGVVARDIDVFEARHQKLLSRGQGPSKAELRQQLQLVYGEKVNAHLAGLSRRRLLDECKRALQLTKRARGAERAGAEGAEGGSGKPLPAWVGSRLAGEVAGAAAEAAVKADEEGRREAEQDRRLLLMFGKISVSGEQVGGIAKEDESEDSVLGEYGLDVADDADTVSIILELPVGAGRTSTAGATARSGKNRSLTNSPTPRGKKTDNATDNSTDTTGASGAELRGRRRRRAGNIGVQRHLVRLKRMCDAEGRHVLRVVAVPMSEQPSKENSHVLRDEGGECCRGRRDMLGRVGEGGRAWREGDASDTDRV
jgi:hypothetical protein